MMKTTLWELSPGSRARIARLNCPGLMGSRLLELGFMEGERVRKVLSGKAIAAYHIQGTLIALRRADARDILVDTED